MNTPRRASDGWFDPDTNADLRTQEVIGRASRAAAVLLGEQHDVAIHHKWQLDVSRQIFAIRPDIVMGFEMFPARLNPVLAEWTSGELDEASFLRKAEWGTVWGFDAELYMDLFRFCRDQSVPMIGLNCRRALVSEVGVGGWDSIAAQDREGLTKAAPASRAYREYLFDVTGGARKDRAAKSPHDPAFDRFVRAQQTWDRAFACRIADAIQRPDPPLVIGIIGRGHLEYRHGTPAQLDDLGVKNTMVLLPMVNQTDTAPQIADAVCYLS